jgi:hypothetical protein
MKLLAIPAQSKEYLKLPVTSPDSVAVLAVHMAVLPRGQDPGDNDWKTAEWVSSATTVRILIGPGSPDIGQLGEGIYVPWVKVTANPEIPVLEGIPFRIT